MWLICGSTVNMDMVVELNVSAIFSETTEINYNGDIIKDTIGYKLEAVYPNGDVRQLYNDEKLEYVNKVKKVLIDKHKSRKYTYLDIGQVVREALS